MVLFFYKKPLCHGYAVPAPLQGELAAARLTEGFIL